MEYEAGFTRQWGCPRQPVEAVPLSPLPSCVDRATLGNPPLRAVCSGLEDFTWETGIAEYGGTRAPITRHQCRSVYQQGRPWIPGGSPYPTSDFGVTNYVACGFGMKSWLPGRGPATERRDRAISMLLDRLGSGQESVSSHPGRRDSQHPFKLSRRTVAQR